MHVRVLVSAILLWLFASSVQAAEITPAGINDSQWGNSANDEALLIKAQILLDRARFSPGEIDGRDGENYRKALTAFAREHSIESKGNLLSSFGGSSLRPPKSPSSPNTPCRTKTWVGHFWIRCRRSSTI